MTPKETSKRAPINPDLKRILLALRTDLRNDKRRQASAADPSHNDTSIVPKHTAEIIDYGLARSILTNSHDSGDAYLEKAIQLHETRASMAGPVIGNRIAQLIDGSIAITMESPSRRVLSILRCAAGGADHGLDRRHPELQEFAGALIGLPNDQRLSQLTDLFTELQHHLPEKERDMVQRHIDRMNVPHPVPWVMNQELGKLQGALDEALNALYPSKWLASEVKVYIETEMRDAQDAMVRALNIFRSATGIAIPVNITQSETQTHAKLLRGLRADDRLEYIQDLYKWVGGYLTCAQRRAVEHYLADAENALSAYTCPRLKAFQLRLNAEWLAIESERLIREIGNPGQDSTVQALKELYRAAGGTAAFKAGRRDAAEAPDTRSGALDDASRLEYVRALYAWLATYLTPTQREMIEQFLKIAFEAGDSTDAELQQQKLNSAFKTLQRQLSKQLDELGAF